MKKVSTDQRDGRVTTKVTPEFRAQITQFRLQYSFENQEHGILTEAEGLRVLMELGLEHWHSRKRR